MKVYILDPFYPSGVEYAQARGEIIRWDDPRVANWHDDADGVMVRMTRIGADDMARAKKLRVISKQGVGIDNIDLAAAKARGIAVCRTPGVNKEAVAEMALTLALSVASPLPSVPTPMTKTGTPAAARFVTAMIVAASSASLCGPLQLGKPSVASTT